MKLPTRFLSLCIACLVALVGCDDVAPIVDAEPGDAGGDADHGVLDGDAADGDVDSDGDVGSDSELAEPEWPLIEEGLLHAGRADSTLDLPVGLPMAAYTTRSTFFGGNPVDGRDTPYTWSFIPSTGVQTRIPLRVVWLEAGDQRVVLVKIDLAYAFDGLVHVLERAISEETGVNVTDHVVLITSHSHASYGAFSQAHHLFLGHDRYNPEVADRIARQSAEVAALAYSRRSPAAIGVGIYPNFDSDDLIYENRRGESAGLIDDFGVTVTDDYKDHNLYLIRIDASQGTEESSDDEPLAILFGWGIHGTIMGSDDSLISSETTGAIELKLENHFEQSMTLMHFQVNGGDMTPATTHDDFAMMEELGERAAPMILELWEATDTTTGPLRLEALVRTIPLGRDIRVTRDGEVDLHYLPHEGDYEPDLEIFGHDGRPLNPFDEFTAPFGAAQCGEDTSDNSVLGMGVDVYPYSSCIRIDSTGEIMLQALFSMSRQYDLEFPLWETRSTMIAAVALDEIPVTTLGTETRDDRVILGFLPGEPCTMLGRSYQWRGTERHDLGTMIPVGYAMDHEGYLMVVDNWMRGGYEASINVWGPLQGEYILDQVVALSELAATPEAENPRFPRYQDQDYPDWPMEPVVPEVSTRCGSVPNDLPEHLWTRDGWRPESAQPASSVRRVSEIAHFVFRGGDPTVDMPTIVLQQEVTPGAGDFEDVTLPSGQSLSDRGYDMIVAYTPTPLTTAEGSDRDHLWLVEWQAVTDRPSLQHMAGVSEGRYRFSVSGRCADPSEHDYPYQGMAYLLRSEPFEVTGEGALDVGVTLMSGFRVTLSVSYSASPRGFRLLHMTSGHRTPTPVVGGDSEPAVNVELVAQSGASIQVIEGIQAPSAGDASTIVVDLAPVSSGSYVLRVSDVFGNRGSVPLNL